MRLIIGLMSGTSVDAIDAALVRISNPGWKSGAFAAPRANTSMQSKGLPLWNAKVLHHIEHKWPPGLRTRLLAAMAPANTTTQEICQLNFLVAQEFANAVKALIKSADIRAARITALASHGQTICHLPPIKSKINNRHSTIPSTLQLGDPSVLATLTGIRTVGNFRPTDMAVGGQGAPLVPFADAMLFSHTALTRCVQNIGGIANVTFLPLNPGWKSGAYARVRAFDTGPGNMAIDALVSLATKGRQRFDRDGKMAARGELDPQLLRRLQTHPYFSRKPPKSTGREEFGLPFAKALFKAIPNHPSAINNLIHTLTRLTAWSIADAYRRFLPRMPDEVILCGGGADNPVLVSMLREELGAAIAVRRIDDFGIPNKAKEAASFALLGAATLDGVAGNLPRVTGAKSPVVLGVVASPNGPEASRRDVRHGVRSRRREKRAP